MKDKHKSLDDLDLVTELSMSELEQISGGITNFTQDPRKNPNGRPTPSAPTGTRQPQQEGSIISQDKLRIDPVLSIFP
jgi:bacteriocin-like protein